MKSLPLGEQTFKDIIETNKLYVDKTQEVYKLFETENKFFFLSRPRRFGKSLLISTLQEIFLGNKKLFKDLWIYDKIEWKKYPVLRIDFNGMVYSQGTKAFIESLDSKIKDLADEYNIELEKKGFKKSFKELIEKLAKTEKVVILIDEYDKPIIEYIENIEKSKEMREIIRDFYITLKEADEYIHFAFLTGVSKFSKTSIFSALNNLTDISLSKKFSKIVGIDEDQLYSYFKERIIKLALKLEKTEQDLKKELKTWYNGYSWDGITFIYNPYSLLLLFENQEINNYWFETGTPTFLLKIIKEHNIDIKDFDNCVLTKNDFSTYDVDDMNVYALLFQTGYLTIKGITNSNSPFREYILSYPNMEVKESLLSFILKDYTEFKQQNKAVTINRIVQSLEIADLDEFFKQIRTIFDDIPYDISIPDKESYYHTILYIIINLIGIRVTAEMQVSTGRIDCVIENDKNIFIFEFKLGTAKKAMDQIEAKKYYNKYLASNKSLYLVGVGFSVKIKNIKNYLIKKIN